MFISKTFLTFFAALNDFFRSFRGQSNPRVCQTGRGGMLNNTGDIGPHTIVNHVGKTTSLGGFVCFRAVIVGQRKTSLPVTGQSTNHQNA
jgi:hypothetical protein